MHIGWPVGEKANFPMSFGSPESVSIPTSCLRPPETGVSGFHMNNDGNIL